MRLAAAGAFLDVVAAATIAAIAIMVGGIEIDALWLLLALIGLSAIDVCMRYLITRLRALR